MQSIALSGADWLYEVRSCPKSVPARAPPVRTTGGSRLTDSAHQHQGFYLISG